MDCKIKISIAKKKRLYYNKKGNLMKKIIITIFIIVGFFLVFFFRWYNSNLNKLNEIKSFNQELEPYLKEEGISGVDLTSLMHKAIDENTKNNVEKDKTGRYINNNINSLEITIAIDKSGNIYPMEAFDMIGIEEFKSDFDTARFKVTSIKKHESGRISRIDFEIMD